MAKIDVKALKSEAEKYRGKGKLEKAIEIYEQIHKAVPNDAKILQRMAELYLKLGRDEDGVNAYRTAMKGYLENGFLVQAIAVGKILQEIVDDEEINKEVEELLAKKRGSIIGKIQPVKAPVAAATTPVVKPEPKPAEAKIPSQPAKPAEKPVEAKPASEPIEIPEEEPETEESGEAEPATPAKKPGPKVIEIPEEVAIDEELEKLLEEKPEEAKAQEKKRGPAIEVPEEILEEAVADSGDEQEVSEPEFVEEPEAEKSSMDFLLFADLNEQEFAEVYKKLRSVKIPAGIKVCREEEEGDSIFIIAQGEADVLKKDSEGKERLVAHLKAGDFFGEFAYFTGGKRQATVEAKTDLELLEISKADMDDILEKYPQVKELMLRFYKERVLDNLLALSPLTSSLSPEDRRKLIERLELQEVAPGEVVVKEGDPGDSMYLIKSGKVEVTTLDPRDRRRLTLARLGAGEFFGEVSLIKNKPRTATITALNPTELLHMDRPAFEQLSKEHPELVKMLEQIIEKRVEATIKKIVGDKE